MNVLHNKKVWTCVVSKDNTSYDIISVSSFMESASAWSDVESQLSFGTKLIALFPGDMKSNGIVASVKDKARSESQRVDVWSHDYSR